MNLYSLMLNLNKLILTTNKRLCYWDENKNNKTKNGKETYNEPCAQTNNGTSNP